MHHKALYSILFALILIPSTSCQGRKNKDDVTSEMKNDSVQIEVSIDTSSFSNLDEEDYIGPFNIPAYFGFKGTGWFEPEEMALPVIPGLIYRTTKCYHLAVRVQEIPPVLKWTSDQIYDFLEDCANSDYAEDTTIHHKVAKCTSPVSVKAICDFYGRIMPSIPIIYSDESKSFHIEQGLLLADVMKTDEYCTMEMYSWFDFHSNGDQTRRSWHTINLTTGKELTFSDIVKDDRTEDFKFVAMKHLLSRARYRQYSAFKKIYKAADIDEIFNQMSGIAMVPDGVVVYFYPYEIGCGAEGQYSLLIPYSEAEGMLKVSI